jgi:hypothetical protein
MNNNYEKVEKINGKSANLDIIAKFNKLDINKKINIEGIKDINTKFTAKKYNKNIEKNDKINKDNKNQNNRN